PSIYENNHIDNSWQSSLRHTFGLGGNSLLLTGVEADGDSITSNNLGAHVRNRGAGYLDLDLRPAKSRWDLSAGTREEVFSGGPDPVFAPQLAGSIRLSPQLRLRASAGYGFRIPTYTDLYYSDPSSIGDPDLNPNPHGPSTAASIGAHHRNSASLPQAFTPASTTPLTTSAPHLRTSGTQPISVACVSLEWSPQPPGFPVSPNALPSPGPTSTGLNAPSTGSSPSTCSTIRSTISASTGTPL